MIPATWLPVHRPSDDELVGYLVPDEDGFQPVSRVGHPMGAVMDEAAARSLLHQGGLIELNRRFWTDWPGEGWTNVVIIETSPVEVRFRREWAEPAQLRETITIPNPVGDTLRHEPP